MGARRARVPDLLGGPNPQRVHLRDRHASGRADLRDGCFPLQDHRQPDRLSAHHGRRRRHGRDLWAVRRRLGEERAAEPRSRDLRRDLYAHALGDGFPSFLMPSWVQAWG